MNTIDATKVPTASSQSNLWNKFVALVGRQATEIQNGGWPILLRKLAKVPVMLVALSVVLLIRLLRPALVVRFRRLRYDRIGHFAANTEVYLCERDAGLAGGPKRSIDIFYCYGPVCNEQLRHMWGRVLRMWPGALADPVDRLNRLLPGGDAHVVAWRDDHARDIHNLLDRCPAHLSFLPEEELKGRACLKAMGVPEGAKFVCFHARDSAYLESTDPGIDCRLHNYRDSDINNYVLAAEELTRLGYYAIRMGAVVKQALQVTDDRIIDYATNGHRSDFMDIYLGAHCAFFISSGTGIDAIPEVFRRPYAFVSLVPLEYASTWNSDHIFIPKKYWLVNEGRFMTFLEIITSGAGRFLWSEQYAARGIELIENRPDEIAALAMEMESRLKGTWDATEEDEELQHRFWSVYPRSELHGRIVSRIGTDFLRENKELLD